MTTKNKETKHYIQSKHKRETQKTAVANKTNYTLVWYGFYDLQLGNRAGIIGCTRDNYSLVQLLIPGLNTATLCSFMCHQMHLLNKPCLMPHVLFISGLLWCCINAVFIFIYFLSISLCLCLFLSVFPLSLCADYDWLTDYWWYVNSSSSSKLSSMQ